MGPLKRDAPIALGFALRPGRTPLHWAFATARRPRASLKTRFPVAPLQINGRSKHQTRMRRGNCSGRWTPPFWVPSGILRGESSFWGPRQNGEVGSLHMAAFSFGFFFQGKPELGNTHIFRFCPWDNPFESSFEFPTVLRTPQTTVAKVGPLTARRP